MQPAHRPQGGAFFFGFVPDPEPGVGAEQAAAATRFEVRGRKAGLFLTRLPGGHKTNHTLKV